MILSCFCRGLFVFHVSLGLPLRVIGRPLNSGFRLGIVMSSFCAMMNCLVIEWEEASNRSPWEQPPRAGKPEIKRMFAVEWGSHHNGLKGMSCFQHPENMPSKFVK